MQSGADMAAASEFVDPGGFLENRSMPDIETIFKDADKRFNLPFLKWTSNNQV